MSGYGEGWRLIQNPEVARETELAREREVRARFEGRIEERRLTKTRLERAAEEATRRSNAFEQEVSQKRAEIVKYEEDLVTQRNAKAQNETVLAQIKHTFQLLEADKAQARQHNDTARISAIIDDERVGKQRMREYLTCIKRINETIAEIEYRLKDTQEWATMAEAMGRQRAAMADEANQEAMLATQLWEEARGTARNTWPVEWEERERIYLRDLILYLEDNVPVDRVRVSAPRARDDSRPQTAGGPYIFFSAVNNRSWGRFYVQCGPERAEFRFLIHYTSLKPGAEDTDENQEIEYTVTCLTEDELAETLRRWIRLAGRQPPAQP
jgi:hypothetical protein